MFRFLLALIVLVAIPSISYSQQYGLGGSGLVGGRPDAGGLTALNLMDFEGVGCADGDGDAEPNEVCDLVASGADPDCTTGVCGLEQSTSVEADDTEQARFLDGAAYTGSEEYTLDFMMNDMDAATTLDDSLQGIAAIQWSTSVSACAVLCKGVLASPDGAEMECAARVEDGSNDVTSSLISGLDEGATHYFRIVAHRGTSDAPTCTLYVDPSNFGGGTPVTATSGEVTYSTLTILGWRVSPGFGGVGVVYDDIHFCEGDAGSDHTSGCELP